MYYIILISPLLVASLVVATLISLLLGYWIAGVVLLTTAILINWRTEAFALNFRSSQRHGKGNDTFKVLTYNLNRASSTSVNSGTEQDVLDVILTADADIVLLQEFNPTLYGEINSGLKNEYPYGSEGGDGNRFKSVFSRYPITDYLQLTDETEILPICSMLVDVKGKLCRIVTCHLKSNDFSVVYREMKSQGRGLFSGIRKANLSIRNGYRTRQKQVDVLLQHLKGKDGPTFICGDFNDVSQSITLRKFSKEGFKDAWWNNGMGFGFTYWGMKMRFRLDHIIYNGCIKPVQVRVIQSKVSDHRLLVAAFSIG